MKSALMSIAAAGILSSVNAMDYPVIKDKARVKQHMFGANADLVKGEEEMLKIIVYWTIMDGAQLYEVCHNCNINDETGVRDGETGGVHEVEEDEQCMDDMCFVQKNAPKGKNRYNVRVKTRKGWSR